MRAVLGPRLAECWTQVRDKVEFAENGENIPADMYAMFDDVYSIHRWHLIVALLLVEKAFFSFYLLSIGILIISAHW